jgi:hypothetical protein
MVCIRVVTCPDDGATIINTEHPFYLFGNFRKNASGNNGKYLVDDICPCRIRPYGRSILVVYCVILEPLSTGFAGIAVDAEANR